MEPSPREGEFLDALERHQGILHRVSGLYADGIDARRDLFQEMVYQLWRAWPRFRGEAAVTTWMYRVVLNTAFTRLRRGRGGPEMVSLDGAEPALERAAATATATAASSNLDSAAERDRSASLQVAIRALAPADRAVVMLHLEDLSHREIGDVLGISEGNVAVKLHRIRGRLRTLMEGEVDGK